MEARKGFGKPYDCKKDWPENCFVQCGGDGLVLRSGSMEEVLESEGLSETIENLAKNTSYTTAFFEAFPRNPDTFIRGEGTTIEEAEDNAFSKFEKYSACDHPEFEKRDYKNGYGFCVKCGMGSSGAFEPEYKCRICGQPTYYTFDKHDQPYCEDHASEIAWEDLPKSIQALRKYQKRKDS